ncbi:hypothetical protein AgCh_005742 [Apium graveolens]
MVLISYNFKELEAQLEVGYYGNTCGMAEYIVKDEVRNAYYRDPGLAAGLVRLHFHDCFVRGCDGSGPIDSTASNSAEKDSPTNNPSLRGFEVIDNAKAKLEAMCRGVVSCADIVAFAARDSIEMTGGIGYDVPAGRKDGRVSLASEASSSLPAPSDNLNQLTQSFANRGLTQEEMVLTPLAALIAHHSVTDCIITNYNTTSMQDPSMDPLYAVQLKQQCPQRSPNMGNFTVPINPSSPAMADTDYYMDVLANRGLHNSDQTLLSSPMTTNQVAQNAMNPMFWRSKFAAAMVKMGRIGVLTGKPGEIRATCRVIN